jgi:hypothetical protein
MCKNVAANFHYLLFFGQTRAEQAKHLHRAALLGLVVVMPRRLSPSTTARVEIKQSPEPPALVCDKPIRLIT